MLNDAKSYTFSTSLLDVAVSHLPSAHAGIVYTAVVEAVPIADLLPCLSPGVGHPAVPGPYGRLLADEGEVNVASGVHDDGIQRVPDRQGLLLRRRLQLRLGLRDVW